MTAASVDILQPLPAVLAGTPFWVLLTMSLGCFWARSLSCGSLEAPSLFCCSFLAVLSHFLSWHHLISSGLSLPHLWFWFPTPLGLLIPFWSQVGSVSFQHVGSVIPVTSLIQSPWISSFSTPTPSSRCGSTLGFPLPPSPPPLPTVFVPPSV